MQLMSKYTSMLNSCQQFQAAEEVHETILQYNTRTNTIQI